MGICGADSGLFALAALHASVLVDVGDERCSSEAVCETDGGDGTVG